MALSLRSPVVSPYSPWMGQCIGRRNYRFFLGFVTSVVALCGYTLAISGYVGYRAALQVDPRSFAGDFFSKVAHKAPVAMSLVGLPGLIMLCVAPLACYHATLVCANKTTSEEIKDVRSA